MSEKEIEGVPMPKPVAYGFGNTAITGHTNRLMMVRIDVPLDDQYAGAFWLPLVLADEAHTYGIACRAAGEAAGYAQGLRDAVRDADIEALRLYVRALCKAVDAATDFAGTVAGGASWWDDVWADHAAALDRARERISGGEMMSTNVHVQQEHPMMRAWNAYKATPEYANSKSWAQHAEYVDGSLWALFMAGWMAAEAELRGEVKP